MKRLIGLSVSAVVLAVCFNAFLFTASAAPPMHLIEENADWVFHFNLQYFRHSEMGRMVLAEMPEDVCRRIESTGEVIGSDLLEDVNSVTLYGQGGDPQQAVAIFQGRFNHEKLKSLLRADAHYQETEHRQWSIHRWRGFDERTNYGSFAAHDTIIISNSHDSLELGLDVFGGRAGSAAGNRDFASLWRVPGDAIMAVYVRELGDLAAEHGHATVWRQAQAMLLHLSERQGDLHFSGRLDTGDAEAAQLMANVAQGMRALARLSPELEEAGLAKIAEKMYISAVDTELVVELEYPSSDLASLIEEARNQAEW